MNIQGIYVENISAYRKSQISLIDNKVSSYKGDEIHQINIDKYIKLVTGVNFLKEDIIRLANKKVDKGKYRYAIISLLFDEDRDKRLSIFLNPYSYEESFIRFDIGDKKITLKFNSKPNTEIVAIVKGFIEI